MSYFAKRPRRSVHADDASSSSDRSDQRPSTDDEDRPVDTMDESEGPLGTPRLHRERSTTVVVAEDLQDLGINKDITQKDDEAPGKKEAGHDSSTQTASGVLGHFRSLTSRLFPEETRPKDATLHNHHLISMQGFKTHVPADIEELESTYRILPLAIGCIIPVSILINVPSLTSPWVGTSEYDPATKLWSNPQDIPLPTWINGMIIGALVMAVLCNVCVLSRFLERHIWHSVVLSLITATLQDVLSIGAVVPFCLKYRHEEGYVYLEGFWTMVASMILSLAATVMLSIDFYRTPHFRLHGSGVTHKQRILIAEAMSLCFYLAIGALIFIWIEKWSFVESLFFVMVTITTIGFGNTVPKTSAGQTFVIFYGAGGIVLFAMAVNAIRYVILEDLHRQFALRAKERKAKRDARRRQRKEERIREKERRKRVQETLKQLALVDGSSILDPNQNSRSHRFMILQKHFSMHANPKRMSSLFTLGGGGGGGGGPHENSASNIGNNNNNNNNNNNIPSDEMSETMSGEFSDSTLANNSSPETRRKKEHLLIEMLQRPTESVGRLSVRETDSVRDISDVFKSERPSGEETDREQAQSRPPPTKVRECDESSVSRRRRRPIRSLFRMTYRLTCYIYRLVGQACGWRSAESCSRIAEVQPTAKEQREADKKLAHEESMEEYRRRLRFSFLMFLSFWLIGAAVFRSLEGWTYGQAMYFSFVAFSTIGYGDLVPLTLAGRSIFLAYCLVGIVTLTFLASLVSELLSKSMRRHVVQTQLRRSERFLEHGDKVDGRSNDMDLEKGEVDSGGLDGLNDVASDDGLQEERMRTLQNLIAPAATDEVEGAQPQTCQGSLRNLVQVSRDFDTLLQKVLGLDYGAPGEIPVSDTSVISPAVVVESSSNSILEYLEKGDDDDSSYLSPSISRDVTSTSSIHRQSKATARSFMDPKLTGTYHGTGYSTPPSSQFSITAWPTSAAAAAAGTSTTTNTASIGRHHDHLHRRSQDGASSPTATSTPAHRHNADGTVTIAAVHWQHLIEYSKQFRVLTDSCDQTLQRLLAWEASEKKMCLKRRQTKERQQRLLRERRLRLFELGGTYGAVDDGIEDEEELEEWDEEGSGHEDEYDEDDEEDGGRGIYSADAADAAAANGGVLDDDALAKTREGIADALLGTERPLLAARTRSQPLVESPSSEVPKTHVRRTAVPSRVAGVAQAGSRTAAPSRGRSFHPPASHDMSADESSTTAVSVTGGGGGMLSSSAYRETQLAHQAREHGATRRRSRSRTRLQQQHHHPHNQQSGSGSGSGSSHTRIGGPQRPPLHTIHTNMVLPSGAEDNTQEDDAS